MREQQHRNPLAVYTLGLGALSAVVAADWLSSLEIFSSLYSELSISRSQSFVMSSGLIPPLLTMFLIYIGLYKLLEHYMLASKYATAIAITLALTSIVVCALQVDYSLVIALGSLLLLTNAFLGSYQQNEAQNSYLFIGLLSFGLCALDVRMLLTLPLWVHSGYLQQSISAKALGALLVGFLSMAMMYLAYLLYSTSTSEVVAQVQLCGQSFSDITILRLEYRYILRVLFISILSIGSISSYSAHRHQENIRQRIAGSMLSSWVLYSAIGVLLYPESLLLLLNVLGNAILTAKGLAALKGKAHRTALGLLFGFLIMLAVLI